MPARAPSLTGSFSSIVAPAMISVCTSSAFPASAAASSAPSVGITPACAPQGESVTQELLISATSKHDRCSGSCAGAEGSCPTRLPTREKMPQVKVGIGCVFKMLESGLQMQVALGVVTQRTLLAERIERRSFASPTLDSSVEGQRPSQ